MSTEYMDDIKNHRDKLLEENKRLKELNAELLEALEQALTRIDPKSYDTWDKKAILVAKAAIQKAKSCGQE